MSAHPRRQCRQSRPRRVSAALALALFANSAFAQTSPPPLETGWKDAATFLFNDANQVFKNAKKEANAPERERALGEAATLLNLQPRTQANLRQAREIFERLARDQNDSVAIFATYLLARLHQHYDEPAQPEKARQLYRDLLEHHAGNVVAESGASQLVLIDLYEPVSTGERQQRFEALEKIAPLLKTASGRRGYHLNMGNAYLDFSGPRAKALEHLLAADAERITRWQVEATTWISIGELARAEGRHDLAAAYYRKFLEKYQRDNRHYTIQKRLDSLVAQQDTGHGRP